MRFERIQKETEYGVLVAMLEEELRGFCGGVDFLKLINKYIMSDKSRPDPIVIVKMDLARNRGQVRKSEKFPKK